MKAFTKTLAALALPIVGAIIVQSSPASADDVVACNIYAAKAASLQVANEENECGFSGPRWHRDIGAHFNWCMENASSGVPEAEERARDKEFATCTAGQGVPVTPATGGVYTGVNGSGPNADLCLDANLSDPRGTDNKGFNAIMWKCNGGVKNQKVRWVGKVGTKDKPSEIVFEVNGQPWCLTAGIKQPTGAEGKGLNAMVWPRCGGYNQKWYAEDGMIKTNLKTGVYCLDINEDDKTGANGQGKNVIVWPECHGRDNQQWRLYDTTPMSGEEAPSSNKPPEAVVYLVNAKSGRGGINIERTGKPEVTSFDSNWDSAKWVVKMLPGSENQVWLKSRATGCFLNVQWKPELLEINEEEPYADDDAIEFETTCAKESDGASVFEFQRKQNAVTITRKDKSCYLTTRTTDGKLICFVSGFNRGDNTWFIRNAQQDGNQGPFRVSDQIGAFIKN
jgi:hypothetical protein